MSDNQWFAYVRNANISVRRYEGSQQVLRATMTHDNGVTAVYAPFVADTAMKAWEMAQEALAVHMELYDAVGGFLQKNGLMPSDGDD